MTGCGFLDADGLCGLLRRLLRGERAGLARLRGGVVREAERRWDAEWERVVGPLLGVC